MITYRTRPKTTFSRLLSETCNKPGILVLFCHEIIFTSISNGLGWSYRNILHTGQLFWFSGLSGNEHNILIELTSFEDLKTLFQVFLERILIHTLNVVLVARMKLI